jgi:hypothetical protein
LLKIKKRAFIHSHTAFKPALACNATRPGSSFCFVVVVVVVVVVAESEYCYALLYLLILFICTMPLRFFRCNQYQTILRFSVLP